MAGMFRVLFASVLCLFVFCGASGGFPVMAHSNDATLLRQEKTNAVETTAKDAKKMGDEIVGGYAKIHLVVKDLKILLDELLKNINVVEKEAEDFADNSENILLVAINNAKSEIIQAALSVEKIQNITIRSVTEGSATTHKIGDLVHKAAAVRATLDSVKNVDWAKEEKELKVIAETLRDLWGKSKKDVEWQTEEANNAFERINKAIGETENAVKIVAISIKNEKVKKAYAEAKENGDYIEEGHGAKTDKNGEETDRRKEETAEKEEETEEETSEEIGQNLKTLEGIDSKLAVINTTLKESINKTSEIRAELAELQKSITNTMEKYQNVIESVGVLTVVDKTAQMAKTELDAKEEQQLQRGGDFTIYDGSAVIYCLAELAGLSFVVSAVFSCLFCF